MNISFSPSCTDAKKVEEGTHLLLNNLHLEDLVQNLEIQVDFHDEPQLSVTRDGEHLHITCQQPAHYYRGLNWALHHMGDASSQKTESVYFTKNGFMLDCSRNAVSTVEKVKSLIRTMAKMGLNVLMLYTEETYTIPEEPYFGAYRGRYSQDEIREMDAYAQLFGIELVPCIQTLAHLHNALKWPLGNNVRDTADILQVGKEEVYVLIEQMLRSVKETFSTHRVHLGMDEAVQLGLGNYLRENGYQKSSVLIKEHCDRVLAICEKLGLEPMIWSDMYITANTNGGYYDPTPGTDCSSWEKPQDNLSLVYWDYYHPDRETYETMIQVHKQLSKNVIFAGGAWNWNGITPNYSRAFTCTLSALASCKKYQISEVFCTGWMDNGAETPVDAILPSMALFAHLGFHEAYDPTALKEEFKDTVHADLDDFLALDTLDALFLNDKPNLDSENPSKYLLYQDPMLGIFDYHIGNLDTQTYYQKVADRLMTAQESSSAYKEFFTFYQKLATVLTQKADLGVRIKKAYDTNDLSTLETLCEKVIPEIVQELWNTKLLREQLWMNDAKPFGYELLDIKFGGIITRLESTKRRIRAYLDGTCKELPELHEPRIPYFQENSFFHGENRWHRIVSGADFTDTI